MMLIIYIAKFKFRRYQLRAILTNSMLTKFIFNFSAWGSTSLVISNQSSVDAEEFDMDTSPSLPAVAIATPTAAASSSHSCRNQSTSNMGTAYRPRPKVVHF